ncbi:TPA: hypothetical protein OXK91_003878, partial [Acinetobacter baumannii]|nr:hypothetical protein [Acinetobacter baumannii]
EAMIAAGYLRIDDLQSAIDIAAAAGAGANGWTADLVVDGDKTQKQINEEQNERKSVKLWATSLVDALSKYNSVDFDEDENINVPVALMSGQNITSNNHELNQTTPSTIVLEG